MVSPKTRERTSFNGSIFAFPFSLSYWMVMGGFLLPLIEVILRLTRDLEQSTKSTLLVGRETDKSVLLNFYYKYFYNINYRTTHFANILCGHFLRLKFGIYVFNF